MKPWKPALFTAVAIASAPFASNAGDIGSQIHVSGGGAPCIHDEGSTYDASTNWYEYHWSNSCNVIITLKLYRYDSNNRQFTDFVSVPAYGSASKILQRASSVDWAEQF